jgi:hypothetical protein
VSAIVAQVMGRTEGRAVNKGQFNPRMEFWLGLDELLSEKHYWWARKVFSFATVIEQQNYDLSLTGVGNANAPDLQEIEEIFLVNAAPILWPYCVRPDFLASQQIGAIYGNNAIAGLIPQTGYFIGLGGGADFQQFTLSGPPDSVYTIAGTYYAVPMVTNISQDVIPLVPPNLHWGLIYMLERRVYEFLYGQEDPRFQMANSRYQQFVMSAARRKNFSQQAAVHVKTNRPAVGAHGGRGYLGYTSGSGGGNPPY